MYGMKCRQSDTSNGPVLFETVRQIKVSHAIFKVTSFVDLDLIENHLSKLH